MWVPGGRSLMQERFLTTLTEGMAVYDANNDKVGSVGKVFRRATAVAPSGTQAATSPESETAAESCFKVDTGFLGLGKDLFIPTHAIADVSGDRVMLNVDKDRL